MYQINSAELVEYLIPLLPCLNTKIGILSEVKFEITTEEVRLTAFNGISGITYNIEKESKNPLSFCVGGQQLLKIAKVLIPSKLNFELERGTLKITSDNAKFELPVSPISEFPILPELKLVTPGYLDIKENLDLLNQLALVASDDYSRPVLNCVYFNAGCMDAVATDSHRLATSKLTNCQIPESLMIPAQNVLSILAIFKEHNIVNYQLGENHVEFRQGGKRFFTRLIDGTYPDYKKLLPLDFSHGIELDGNEILDALKLLNPVIESRQILDIMMSSNSLEMSTEKEGRSAKVSIPFQGIDVAINFSIDYNYFKQGLKEQSLILKYNSSRSPIVLEYENFSYLVMPIVTHS